MYKTFVSKGINYKDWQKEKTVIIAVSIYNSNFYDKKFVSIFNWAKNNFEKIELIICDSLHRYNLIHKNNLNMKLMQEFCVQNSKIDGLTQIFIHYVT